MPQSPSTTLGIAASSSTSIPIGPRTLFGASSLRKRPIAIDTGAATRSAESEVNSVPKMNAAAPNWFVTTLQAFVVMKPGPNSCIAGHAPLKTR